jgi:hypothetical protein
MSECLRVAASAARRLGLEALLGLALGCGTTRMTDTQRTATEQLLISNAVDQAISMLDFSPLSGKTVYFDPQYLEGSVDRGYLVSSLRQHLLASGCILQEDRTKAKYVVEARSGGVGTDRHSVLVGVPEMTVPTFVPGQPSHIPEIPFAKKTDQLGVAKVAVFAYNRQTGQPIWQSGVVESLSTSKDLWLAGAGPFQKGTIRRGTQFAGERLPLPHFTGPPDEDGNPVPVVPVTQAALWPERPAPPVNAKTAGDLLGVAALGNPITGALLVACLAEGSSPQSRSSTEAVTAATNSAPSTPKPSPAAPTTANIGGQAETEPTRGFSSAAGFKKES